MLLLLLEGVSVLAVSLAAETLPEDLSNQSVRKLNQKVCSANKQYVVVATSISSTEKGDLTYVRAPTSSILYRSSQGSIWELSFSLVPVRSLASFLGSLSPRGVPRTEFFLSLLLDPPCQHGSIGRLNKRLATGEYACLHACIHTHTVRSVLPCRNADWLPTDRLAGWPPGCRNFAVILFCVFDVILRPHLLCLLLLALSVLVRVCSGFDSHAVYFQHSRARVRYCSPPWFEVDFFLSSLSKKKKKCGSFPLRLFVSSCRLRPTRETGNRMWESS